MKTLIRYLKLYPHYFSLALKSRMVYKLDWILGLLSLIISNAASFFVLYLTLVPVGSVGGWGLTEIMFMYGFLLIPMGIDHTLTDPLWNYGGNLIKNGELDRILMKPVDPLFQMCAEGFQFGGVGEIALGIAFMASCGPSLDIAWTFSNVCGLICCGLFSIVIYTSIKLFFMTPAFYFGRSMPLMSGVYNLKEYGKYPLTVYSYGGFFGEIMKNILLFVIPYGLIGYLPISCLLFPEHSFHILGLSLAPNIWWVALAIFVTGSVQMGCSLLFFHRGLRHYGSAGS